MQWSSEKLGHLNTGGLQDQLKGYVMPREYLCYYFFYSIYCFKLEDP